MDRQRPAGHRLRERIVGLFRRPPGAHTDFRHGGNRSRTAGLRHRPRRRSNHLGAKLLHRAQHDYQGRRKAGVRRLRACDAQHRSRADASRDHAANQSDTADALRRAAGRHGRTLRARAPARPAGHRGRRARDRLELARPQNRGLWRSRRVQLSPQQEHDLDRRRRAGAQHGRGGEARRKAALSRHLAASRRYARC